MKWWHILLLIILLVGIGAGVSRNNTVNNHLAPVLYKANNIISSIQYQVDAYFSPYEIYNIGIVPYTYPNIAKAGVTFTVKNKGSSTKMLLASVVVYDTDNGIVCRAAYVPIGYVYPDQSVNAKAVCLGKGYIGDKKIKTPVITIQEG